MALYYMVLRSQKNIIERNMPDTAEAGQVSLIWLPAGSVALGRLVRLFNLGCVVLSLVLARVGADWICTLAQG